MNQFITSIIVILLFPLIPLGIELTLTGMLTDKSLMIVTAVYSISVGATSKQSALLLLSMISSLIFSSMFGFLIAGSVAPSGDKIGALLAIIVFFIISLIERYILHVIKKEKFFDFK